jgi:phosphoribosyl 1,2-cyclic phosphate phosphodiesterase
VSLRVTILGCGNSIGVPMLGPRWGACDPNEPRNRRLRPAVLIECGGSRVLVDAGPDIREQLLRAEVASVDAVVLTHHHADHTAGLDDLRPLAFGSEAPVEMHAEADTLADVERRFPYMFGKGGSRTGYYDTPILQGHVAGDRLHAGAVELQLFQQDHVVTTSLGMRIGPFAYSTDVQELNDHAWSVLEGVDTWVVAAVRREPHLAHAHLSKVLGWIERLRPRRAILTHLNHTMDYATLQTELPDGVEPAYDGMVLDFGKIT